MARRSGSPSSDYDDELLGGPETLLESSFLALLSEVLEAELGAEAVEVQPRLGTNIRVEPDLVAWFPDGLTAFEVAMRAPMTVAGLEDYGARLTRYRRELRKGWPETRVVLVLPDGVLAPERREMVDIAGVGVWDRDYLAQRMSSVAPGRLSPEAQWARSWLLDKTSKRRPLGEASQTSQLSARLRQTPAGRADWISYQKLCADVLTYLFCPPLAPPLYESPNATGVNRRDIILPNYAVSGFWEFIRTAYGGDFIVVEAKNVRGAVGKNHVLQVANYLSSAGTGLVGLILTRGDQNRAALFTRREQWILYRKMILVLGDSDLHQMMENKAAGEPPEDVLRQQIQAFRLAL